MLQVLPAGRRWRDAALALLYRQLPERDRDEQQSLVLAAIDRGEIPADDLLVAVSEDRALGAVLAVRRPGGMAFLWPPATVDGHGHGGADVSRALLNALAERLDAAGVQFTQCLLDPQDAAGAERLSAGGFPRGAEMLFLTRPAGALTVDPPPNPLSSLSYNDSTHPQFVRVVERTFAGTLDCPALARMRNGECTLAAHRGTEDFDPGLWRLFRCGNRDVGVVLAADHRQQRAREIAYLGVVPEERGRGIARAMLREVMSTARAAGCDSLEVAVDANNRYALALYRAAGFSERLRMLVHLRLRPEGG